MLEKGDQAPDFTLTGIDGDGNEVEVRLSDLRGAPVVLYFYPKDDTPGCTTQACGIRDEWTEFRDSGAVVLGVSPDDLASHRTFSEKYDLPFTLLADPDHRVAEAYGVWQEKSSFGRKHWGVVRSTFVVDVSGQLAAVFPRVKPKEHAERVLEALAQLA
ncbi:MAG: thioredoxin-dependent thiol peroxidase [Gemmatimonadota bacterium]